MEFDAQEIFAAFELDEGGSSYKSDSENHFEIGAWLKNGGNVVGIEIIYRDGDWEFETQNYPYSFTRLILNKDGSGSFHNDEEVNAWPVILKGLGRLGLYSPRVDKTLGELGSVSAHERLEWQLEYEERLKELAT